MHDKQWRNNYTTEFRATQNHRICVIQPSILSQQIIHANTSEISVRVGEPPLARPREFKAAGVRLVFEKQEDAIGQTNNKKIAEICMLSGDNVQQKTNNRLIEN